MEACKSLKCLASRKEEWTWNANDQRPLEKPESIIKEIACMKFYDKMKPLVR